MKWKCSGFDQFSGHLCLPEFLWWISGVKCPIPVLSGICQISKQILSSLMPWSLFSDWSTTEHMILELYRRNIYWLIKERKGMRHLNDDSHLGLLAAHCRYSRMWNWAETKLFDNFKIFFSEPSVPWKQLLCWWSLVFIWDEKDCQNIRISIHKISKISESSILTCSNYGLGLVSGKFS